MKYKSTFFYALSGMKGENTNTLKHNTMKKTLHLKRALRAALLVLLLSVSGLGELSAQEFWVDGLGYSINPDQTSVTLIACSVFQEELNIPDMVREYEWGPEYEVTAIGTGDLVIPNTVVSIGDSAFIWLDGFNGSF